MDSECKYLIQTYLHFLCQDEIICLSEHDMCLSSVLILVSHSLIIQVQYSNAMSGVRGL